MKLAGDYLAQSTSTQPVSLSFTNSPIHSASETSRGNAVALGVLKHVPSPQGIQHVAIGSAPHPQGGALLFLNCRNQITP